MTLKPKIDVYDREKVLSYIPFLIEWNYISDKWEEIESVIEKPFNYEDEIQKAIMKEYEFLMSNGTHKIKEAQEMIEIFNIS